jgi:hypothetical protein
MQERFLSVKFHHALLHSYHFIVLINHSFWSWSIVEQGTNMIMGGSNGIYHSLSDIEKELNQWDLNSLGKLSIFFVLEENMLVPSAFFDQSKSRELLQFCYDLPQDTFIEINTIPALEMINLFSIPEELHSMTNRLLPKALQYHASTASVLAAHHLSQQKYHPVLLVDIYPGVIFLTIADGGKILFANYFKSVTQEDMLYWIVRLLEQFELDGSKIILYVNGEKSQVNERIAYLISYFNNVSALPFPSFLSVAEDTPEDFFQSFIDLFYLLLCE